MEPCDSSSARANRPGGSISPSSVSTDHQYWPQNGAVYIHGPHIEYYDSWHEDPYEGNLASVGKNDQIEATESHTTGTSQMDDHNYDGSVVQSDQHDYNPASRTVTQSHQQHYEHHQSTNSCSATSPITDDQDVILASSQMSNTDVTSMSGAMGLNNDQDKTVSMDEAGVHTSDVNMSDDIDESSESGSQAERNSQTENYEWDSYEEDAMTPTCVSEDIYQQLAQKERDLVLAAELGKALLEENEELRKGNECLLEEYNVKIEELELDRHALQLRLEKSQGEYDSVMRDLQWDIRLLQEELDTQQQQSMSRHREDSTAIHKLTAQNERLQEQVRQASEAEEELTTQVDYYKEQLASRRISVHSHVQQLDSLRDDISILSSHKHDVDLQLASITGQRNSLAAALEGAQERILQMEKYSLEQTQEINVQQRTLEELQATNTQLQEQVDSLATRSSNLSRINQSRCLLAELSESSGSETNQSQNLLHELSELNESVDGDEEMGSRLQMYTQPHSWVNEEDDEDWPEEDEIECDDDSLQAIANSTQVSDFLEQFHTPLEQETQKLHEELTHVYKHLVGMCQEIRSSQTVASELPTEQAPLHNQHVQADQLRSVLKELRDLIRRIPKAQPMDEEVESKLTALQNELSLNQRLINELNIKVQIRDEEIRRKCEELANLTSQLARHHEEFQSLQTERDHLQDQAVGTLASEDVLEQTRDERNDAISKFGNLEMEIAHAQSNITNLNSELLNAIHKKVDLSQQLDQWQVDMHEVLDIQMQKRIVEETNREQTLAQLEKTKQQQQLLQERQTKKGFFR